MKASEVAIEQLVIDPDAQERTRHVLEPFAALLDPRPRSMKRFVMAYSMLRAVRTAEGSVVGVGPLALWTVVATRWPLLAQHLQSRPRVRPRVPLAGRERVRVHPTRSDPSVSQPTEGTA